MKSVYGIETVKVGQGTLKEGYRYLFVVEDGAYRKDVVAFNKFANYPTEVKGREKETLTPEQIALIEQEPMPRYGNKETDSEKPRYSDFLNFVVVEQETKTRLGKIDEEGKYAMGGLQFELPDGKASKELRSFVFGYTGKELTEATDVKTIIPKGAKFTAKVKQNTRGYHDIQKDTIAPEGMFPLGEEKIDLAQAMGGDKELSAAGKEVIDALVAYKDQLNGKNQDVVFRKLREILSGSLENKLIVAGWQEVKKKVLGPDMTLNL